MANPTSIAQTRQKRTKNISFHYAKIVSLPNMANDTPTGLKIIGTVIQVRKSSSGDSYTIEQKSLPAFAVGYWDSMPATCLRILVGAELQAHLANRYNF